MKITIRLLIVLLLTLMSFSAAQAAFECDDQDPIEIEGMVCDVQKDSKPYQIWIDETGKCDFQNFPDDIYKIFGVPFRDLELQLSYELDDPDVTIDKDDCISIKYYVTLYEHNKFCSLSTYCDKCNECCNCINCYDDCCNCINCDDDDGVLCYGDDMGERPFNKRKSHDHPHHGPRP